MATDRALLKKVQTGHCLSDGLTDAEGEVNKMHRRHVRWVKIAQDTNAADNTAEFAIGYLPQRTKLVSAKWTTSVNVAASNANAITLIVAVRDGAGGSALNVATVNTANANGGGTGSLTLFIPADITRVAANADNIAPSSVLTFTVTKASSGTKLDVGELCCVLEEI